MLTPEVQQYITQQRAAGVSDDQIRQSLSSQGWQAADLDQAFGVAPIGPIASQAPVGSSGNTKKIIWLMIIILPLLIWGGIKIVNNNHNQEQDAYNLINEQIKQSEIKNKTDPNAIKNLADAQAFKLCGNWPGDYPEKAGLIKRDTLDKFGPEFELPTDFHVYPGAVKIAEDGIAYYFCTNDDPDKIISFYLSDQTLWTVTLDPKSVLFPKFTNSGKERMLVVTKDSSIQIKGDQLPKPNVTMLVFKDANQTVLALMPNW